MGGGGGGGGADSRRRMTMQRQEDHRRSCEKGFRRFVDWTNMDCNRGQIVTVSSVSFKIPLVHDTR